MAYESCASTKNGEKDGFSSKTQKRIDDSANHEVKCKI